MGLILLILLFLVFLGLMPVWPYSRGWSYNPAIGIAVIFIIILILVFANVIGFWGARRGNERVEKIIPKPENISPAPTLPKKFKS